MLPSLAPHLLPRDAARRRCLAFLLAVSMLGGASASATAAPPANCAPLPAELQQVVADWERPAQPIKILTRPEGDAPIALGSKAKVTLVPMSEVTLARLPLREDATKLQGYAGIVTFNSGEAGAYRFLTKPYVWIELVSEPAGPPPGLAGSDKRLLCANIPKNVAFDLAANTRYWYQITGSPSAEVELLILPPQ